MPHLFEFEGRRKVKHETFNSILGALGLGLAAVTAWYQFAPVADRIELVNEGRINVGRELEFSPVGLGPLFGDLPMFAGGPVSWKLRVYNTSDRPVSIVSFSVYLLSKAESLVQYSDLRERLSPFDGKLSEQLLPDSIGSREAKAYLMSLSIPISRDQSTGAKCEDQTTQLRELERCFFLKGRDLFGNPVTVKRYDDELNGPISVSWDQGNDGPRFLVVFETADGSKFETVLSYFPDL